MCTSLGMEHSTTPLGVSENPSSTGLHDGFAATSGLFRGCLQVASAGFSIPTFPRVNPCLVFAYALVLAGLTALAPAADSRVGDPGSSPEIALLRLSYERGLIESCLGPVKEQITTLEKLEKQFAASREYDAAITARDERKRLQNELARFDKELLLLQTREQALQSALLPDRIQLPLDSAVLSDVRLEGGAITGWSRTGASATWKLPSLPPGGYEVMLRYRCGAAEGGTLLIKEARFTLTTAIETTLKGPQERSAGILKVSNGSGSLTLSAESLVSNNLMQLLAVELIPASR